MIIERTKKEVIFRIPGKLSVDDLQDLADWLEFKELVKSSKAVQSDVDRLDYAQSASPERDAD
jgi:hypothetical protein